jgi:hypothetical protein
MFRMHVVSLKALIYFSVAFWGINISTFAAKLQDGIQERMTVTVDGFLRSSEAPTAEDWSTGQALQANFDRFINSIRADEVGNVSSFELNSKQYQAVFDGGKLRSVIAGGNVTTFSLAKAANGIEKRIVVMDANGILVGQESPKTIFLLAPQLVGSIEGVISFDSRSIESIGNSLTTPIAEFRSLNRPKTVRTPEMCASDCDGQKELDMAGCDGMFEAELGLIGVLSVMVPEIPDPRLRTLALGSLAAAGLMAVRNKFTCKAGAIASWAACKASC